MQPSLPIPDDTLARCVDLYQQHRYAEVIDATTRHLEERPDEGRLWQLLGLAHWSQSNHLAARSALETASCLRPLAPLGQVALASAYLHGGQKEVARLMYRHLAKSETCPLEMLPKVSVGLGRLGEYSLALDVCAVGATGTAAPCGLLRHRLLHGQARLPDGVAARSVGASVQSGAARAGIPSEPGDAVRGTGPASAGVFSAGIGAAGDGAAVLCAGSHCSSVQRCRRRGAQPGVSGVDGASGGGERRDGGRVSRTHAISRGRHRFATLRGSVDGLTLP